MRWDEAYGVRSGMIGTNQHSQGSASSQCSKPSEYQVDVGERDLALGTDCDSTPPPRCLAPVKQFDNACVSCSDWCIGWSVPDVGNLGIAYNCGLWSRLTNHNFIHLSLFSLPCPLTSKPLSLKISRPSRLMLGSNPNCCLVTWPLLSGGTPSGSYS